MTESVVKKPVQQKKHVEPQKPTNQIEKSAFHAKPVSKSTFGFDESDSSSMSIGKGGSRFIKKKAANVEDETPEVVDFPKKEKPKARVNNNATGKGFPEATAFCYCW